MAFMCTATHFFGTPALPLKRRIHSPEGIRFLTGMQEVSWLSLGRPAVARSQREQPYRLRGSMRHDKIRHPEPRRKICAMSEARDSAKVILRTAPTQPANAVDDGAPTKMQTVHLKRIEAGEMQGDLSIPDAFVPKARVALLKISHHLNALRRC